MESFLLLYRPGPGWLAGKPASQQPLQEHMSYVMNLHGAGTLRFVGQFMDDTGGTLLLNVPTKSDAIAIADSDPAVQAQVFVYDVHPWQIVLGGLPAAQQATELVEG